MFLPLFSAVLFFHQVVILVLARIVFVLSRRLVQFVRDYQMYDEACFLIGPSPSQRVAYLSMMLCLRLRCIGGMTCVLTGFILLCIAIFFLLTWYTPADVVQLMPLSWIWGGGLSYIIHHISGGKI